MGETINLMDHKDSIDLFEDEICKVVEHFGFELDLDSASMIGVLEKIKLRIFHSSEMVEDEEDEDEEDDNDNKGTIIPYGKD